MKKKKFLLSMIVILAILTGLTGGYYYFFFDKNDSSSASMNISPATAHVHHNDPFDLALTQGYIAKNENPDDDADGDGLTNKEEDEYNTDKHLIDTDGDGLSDYDEINTTKTDPLNPDTDGDGLSDGVEVLSGLDPLKAKTDGKTDDSKVNTTNKIDYDDQCSFSIKGNANVHYCYFNKLNLTGFSSTPGVLSPLYEFYYKDDFDTAVLTIKYDEDYLSEHNINTSDIGIYSFNPVDASFSKVKDQSVDADNNAVRATISKSGKYVLCNATTIGKNSKPEVVLLIDNSGSMYSEEDCPGSDENDVDFKRLDMASKLIEMCGDDASFSISKFTSTPTELAPMSSDADTLNAALDKIRTEDETFDGTGIADSLYDSVDRFSSSDSSRKFIVQLTDGAESHGLFSFAAHSTNEAIEYATDNNVTIITIGLGTAVDTDVLTEVASLTGGRYVYANNSNALEEVYKTIMSAINYDLENNTFVLADSGFKADTNGFSFPNYGIVTDDNDYSNGQCFGMAMFSQLYYTGNLPVTLSASSHTSNSLIKNTLTSDEYDLGNNTFFSTDGTSVNTRNNLYDYSNSATKAYKDLKAMDPTKRFSVDDDGYLQFTDEAKAVIANCKFIKTKVIECDDEKTLDDGTKYTSYDSVYFSLEDIDEDELTGEDLEIYEMFTAISNLYTKQFSSECDEHTTSFPTTNVFSGENQNEQLTDIINSLNSGKPYIMSISNSTAGHAVVATKIIRSLDNADDLKIVIYDNNSPGEEHYITVKRCSSSILDFDATSWANGMYYEVYDTEKINPYSDPKKDISIDMYLPSIN
mgnify:FL=1